MKKITFGVLEIYNVVTRVDRPIAADVLDMRTPRGVE
jgi:hypothetical protein